MLTALRALQFLPRRLRGPLSSNNASLRSTGSDLCFWALLGLAVVLRVQQYWPVRSLWHDEAALAVNIVQRSFGELLQPLDFNQGAPIGFLMLEKVLGATFGYDARVLRVVPFLCSLAALPLFWLLARRLVGQRAALIAFGLFALTRPLAFYAGELKQYSSDVFITLTLFWLAFHVWEQTERGERPPWLLWGLTGAVALWFSHAALFVLAGTGMVYAVACLQRRDRTALLRCAGAIGLWLASFGTCYLLFLRSLDHNDYLLAFWRTEFMPLPPHSVGDLEWFPRTFFAFLNSPVGLSAHDMSLAGVGALTFIIGAITLFSMRPVPAALLLAPLLFTLLASGLQRYPFGDRMVLFLVPAMLLVIAVGAEFIRCRSVPLVGLTVLGLLFFAPALGSAGKLLEPDKGEQIEPLLAHLREHRRDGDLVYVYTSAWPGYVYHGPQYGLPTSGAGVQRGCAGGDWGNYLRDLDGLRGRPRVWLLFVHHGRVERLFRCELERRGHKIDAVETPGAAVYLYDLSERPRADVTSK
jgi:hypothetical protein